MDVANEEDHAKVYRERVPDEVEEELIRDEVQKEADEKINNSVANGGRSFKIKQRTFKKTSCLFPDPILIREVLDSNLIKLLN